MNAGEASTESALDRTPPSNSWRSSDISCTHPFPMASSSKSNTPHVDEDVDDLDGIGSDLPFDVDRAHLRQ